MVFYSICITILEDEEGNKNVIVGEAKSKAIQASNRRAVLKLFGHLYQMGNRQKAK